jgi:multicomponent Na+:H+ antiporter subunit E
MTLLLTNLLLAIVWGALSGKATPDNLIEGFVLGYLVLWISRRNDPSGRVYLNIWWRVGSLTLYFIAELLRASFRVAALMFMPTKKLQANIAPAVVAVPLSLERPLLIALLANLITLTPGTLSLDVSPDNKTLYVHTIYSKKNDLDAFRREIKDGFERRIKDLI